MIVAAIIKQYLAVFTCTFKQ